MTSSKNPVDRVDLLLTTDLLSEGVNLQDASVVVHLDVPWTPARLAQRVGRVARLGSAHRRVSVHGLAPPRDVEAWLRVAERLHGKAGAARDVTASRALRTARRLERWMAVHGESATPTDHAVVVAAVRAPRRGLLAAWRDVPGPALVASLGRGRVTDDPAVVARAARLAEGEPAAIGDAELRRSIRLALHRVRAWAAERRAAHDALGAAAAGAGAAGAGADSPRAPDARRAALARLATVLHGAPPDRRPAVAVKAARVRRALARPWSAGHERALADLARADARDSETWLAALGALADAATAREQPAVRSTGTVLLLLMR